MSTRVSDSDSSARSRIRISMSSSELPPASKKFSSIPTSGTPRMLRQMPAIAASTSVRGVAEPAFPTAAASAGRGRDRRSTFPFAVSGRLVTVTNTAGTM